MSSDEDEGLKNVIVSIIENIHPAENAAELILWVIAKRDADADADADTDANARRPPRGPLLSNVAVFPARKKRTRRRAAPGEIEQELSSDDYYPVEVVIQYTGFSRSSIARIVRDEPERLHSKYENGRRLCLGEDIMRLRQERGGMAPEHEEANET